MSGIMLNFAGVTATSIPGAPTIGTATATGQSTATVSFTAPVSDGGSPILSYTAVSTPSGITGTLNQAGSGTITVSGLSTLTSYTFVVFATNAIGNSPNSAASNSITTNAVTGQQEFTTPGTFSWVAPAGVTSVSVVAIGGAQGGGSAGLNQTPGCSSNGPGAGLGYRNNHSVTPGTSYTVVVGAGGTGTSGNGNNGGCSFFISTAVVRGGQSANGNRGTFTGDGGGLGGRFGGPGGGGAGGAGGYSGNGGDGGCSFNTSDNQPRNPPLPSGAGSGGGGAGSVVNYVLSGSSSCVAQFSGIGGGGGTGIFGQGSNGAAKTGSRFTNSGSGTGGNRGSSGGNGADGINYNDTSGTNTGTGGLFGGGGGGGSGRFRLCCGNWGRTNSSGTGASGGGGAVRIIWPGNTRSFPSTNTGNL